MDKAYFDEFRRNLRPLLAACVGSGTGMMLYGYLASVFAPHLVADFHWDRAQFALVGLGMLTTLPLLPVIGRVTDRFGLFPVVATGTVLFPLTYVALAVQGGGFGFYFGITVASLALGSLTSTLTYTRLVTENFERARGLALTAVNCVPAILAIAMVPATETWIERYGWRSAYWALAAFALVCGLVALALVPRRAGRGQKPPPGAPLPDEPMAELASPARGDYREILSSGVFWRIIAGMSLCLLQTPLHASQMNLMLVENHLTTALAAKVVSVYALGTVIGRIACGLALDRFPTPLVAGASMILPSLGFFILGTSYDAVQVIVFAMFLVGLSVGAEGDLVSFLVARYFAIRIYNSTLGLLFTATFLASATGAFGISRSLAWYGSFAPYLFFVSASIATGACLLLTLPWKDTGRIGERAAPAAGD